MRVAKAFGVRDTETKEIKRKFFLVFEGEKTEYQYFVGVNKYKSELNINALVEMKILMRSSGKESISNPKRVVEQLIRYLTETLDNGITCESIVEQVCDYLFYELEISEGSLVNSKSITAGLTSLLQNKFNLLTESKVHDVKDILNEFEIYLKSIYNIEYSSELIEEYINKPDIVFDKKYDRVCIIVDRDKQSFKSDQYDYVYQQCTNFDFDLYVSNPCFELWLLLHFPEADKLNRIELLENKRISSNKKYIDDLLSQKLIGYKKNALNFDIIKDNIDLAIEQEKEFCQDIRKLKHECGTNIGLLIIQMRENKKSK